MTIPPKHLEEQSIRPDAGDYYQSPTPNLASLMMLYQRGDATAVTALVESLSPQLYRFFASQMGSRTEAEDMLQDQPSGTFLIRFSSQPGCFAASFVDMHGNTCKSLITRVHGGFTFEQSERTIYRTIQELVEEFRKNRVFLYPQMTTLRSRVHSSRSSAISLSSFSQILSIPNWNASAANQRILERRSTGGLRSERAHSYHVATAHRRLDVQLWDVNEVQDWLETIQLEMLKDTFRDNEINGVALLDLNELDMRNDLKMVLGHRKKLLKAVQEFV